MIDYKQVALDRFYDALALYEAKRYSASFYMAGYVIEIGVKHKFVELGNTELSKEVGLEVISYMLVGSKTNHPRNLKELAEIASAFSDKESQALSHLKVVTQQRYPNEPGGGFHNIHAFIKELLHWYEVFNLPDKKRLGKFIYTGNFETFYSNSNEEKTIWSTHLRYEPSSDNDETKAKEQLDLCLTFLQNILGYTDAEIRKHLNGNKIQVR